MNLDGITQVLSKHHGEGIVLQTDLDASPQAIMVPFHQIAEVSKTLHEHETLYFDMLSCLTGVDNGPENGTMEVVYNLYSIPFDKSLMVKIAIPRHEDVSQMPAIPTVSHIWKTANWQERETYDLFGLCFEGHPDLRRILLPADWEGYPLRKDYQQQAYYHGISVAYDRDGSEDEANQPLT